MRLIFLNSELLFFRTGTEIVINAGKKQCKAHLQSLKIHFADSLTKVRQSLATPKLHQDETASNLNEMLTSLILSTVEKIKGILQDLLVSKYLSKYKFTDFNVLNLVCKLHKHSLI